MQRINMGYEFRQRLREQVQIQVQKQLQEQVQLKSKEAFSHGISRGADLTLRQNIIGFYKHNVPIATIAASVGKTEDEVEEIIRSGQSEN